MALLIAGFLFLPCTAVCGSIPDTGQTTCYNNSMPMTCPDPGQPFYGQDAHYSINLPSYTKLDANGMKLPQSASAWAMVRDNISGLVWEVKTDDGSIHDRDDEYSWTNAQDLFVAGLNALSFGSFADWRLPALHELSWLAHKDHDNPCIDTDYFVNMMTSDYWTATPSASNEGNAWYVVFLYGYESNYAAATPYYVMAVRGAQTVHDLSDHGDGTVSDMGTGLMWQQGSVGGKSWEEALAYCDNLTLAGHTDWRLPSFNELQSIVDYERYDPAADATVFEGTASSCYWSSTTRSDYAGYAWNLDFYSGHAGNGHKLDACYVRAVRAGQCGPFGDSDNDTICDDGDNSGDPGDSPCTSGAAVICDDNCIDDFNPDQADSDEDMIGDVCDNCPATPNSWRRGSCVRALGGVVLRAGLTCTDNGICGAGTYCQMEPGDCNANGLGDACECYGDIAGPGGGMQDGKVDSFDVLQMKMEYSKPPVKADLNSDSRVDSFDLLIMKAQFGRTGCPVP